MILNYGGPDRSIKTEAFQLGTIKPRRYRNRRLGDFLKELELTEGRATGIPRIRKALKENGSPEPFFDFDEDRTYFEVDFYIHPAFKDDRSIVVTDQTTKSATKSTTKSDESKNQRLGLFIVKEFPKVIADQYISLIQELLPQILNILNLARVPRKRSELLKGLGLKNHSDNVTRYIVPLLDTGLLSATIIDKPTSSNQKYYVTEKGERMLKQLANDLK